MIPCHNCILFAQCKSKLSNLNSLKDINYLLSILSLFTVQCSILSEYLKKISFNNKRYLYLNTNNMNIKNLFVYVFDKPCDLNKITDYSNVIFTKVKYEENFKIKIYSEVPNVYITQLINTFCIGSYSIYSNRVKKIRHEMGGQNYIVNGICSFKGQFEDYYLLASYTFESDKKCNSLKQAEVRNG